MYATEVCTGGRKVATYRTTCQVRQQIVSLLPTSYRLFLWINVLLPMLHNLRYMVRSSSALNAIASSGWRQARGAAALCSETFRDFCNRLTCRSSRLAAFGLRSFSPEWSLDVAELYNYVFVFVWSER